MKLTWAERMATPELQALANVELAQLVAEHAAREARRERLMKNCRTRDQITTETKRSTNQGANMAANKSSAKKERAVLVTTEFRGVFFGYATDTDGETVALRRARNCIYWSEDVRGFLGLATTGPSAKCRIGPAADVELRKVTCVAAVTESAAAAWEAAPWQ